MIKSSKILMLAFALALYALTACQREAPPLQPLSADQIPAEMQKAFANAKPEPKNLVTALLSALESKDYAGAYQAVQMLCNSQEISEAQRTVAARASLAVHSLLQTAQAQGDPNAAAALKEHLINK
jgi:hypothetical protein